MSEPVGFFEKITAEQERAFEKEMKKTEFKSSALSALAWSSVSNPEAAEHHNQRAIAYALLEVARVSGKPQTNRK